MELGTPSFELLALLKPLFETFPPETGEHDVILLKVVDGDTVWVGFITPKKLRLAHVDTPELPTQPGLDAKAFVESKLPVNQIIRVKLNGMDKYDRCLAEIPDPTNTAVTINQELLDNHLAKPYEGGAK